MKDELAKAYERRLLDLFKKTRKHFGSPEFGIEKAIIATTIPLMILENWREDGHHNDIPLLDESVNNIILASACLTFGWEKTTYLHLRVVIENIFNGINLLIYKKNYNLFLNNGLIPYKKFRNLITDFINYNSSTKKVNAIFNISDEVTSIYDKLSKWTHSLGSDFLSDLSILGRKKIRTKNIGELKKYFSLISKYASIVYLVIKPKILTDISSGNQRYLLQNLNLKERKELRDLLGV